MGAGVFEGDGEIAGVDSRFIGSSHAGGPEQARLGLRQCACACYSRYFVACKVADVIAERVGHDRTFWPSGHIHGNESLARGKHEGVHVEGRLTQND